MTTKHFLGRQRRAAAICVTAAIALGLLFKAVPQSYGFAADAQRTDTGLANHSSVHYEFTRVLAAAAGFNTKDAETIAVACEATDTNTFEGYAISGGPITVTFANTHRIKSPNRFFYHFGRRALNFPIVTQPDGTAYSGALQNTCGYFPPDTGTKRASREVTAPCYLPEVGELDQLRAWAINGTTLPPRRAPLVKLTSPIPHDSAGNVTGQNIYALGIYLHALGDSYSHERCFIDAQFRYHKPNPHSCQATWHLESEFGEFTSSSNEAGAGVPFTLTAAEALWQEVLKYRLATGGKPTWTRDQFMDFANAFVALPTAIERVTLAVTTFNELTGETVTPVTRGKGAPTRKSK